MLNGSISVQLNVDFGPLDFPDPITKKAHVYGSKIKRMVYPICQLSEGGT